MSTAREPGDVTLEVAAGYHEAHTGVECFPPARPRCELPLAGLDLIRDRRRTR